MATTTIRVSRALHERLAKHAAARNVSLAAAIEQALDAEEDASFWAEAQATMGTPQALTSIRKDTAELGGTLRDGLDPDERWDDVL